MKLKLLLAGTILSLGLHAQDCKLTKSTDAFTHETHISTGFAPMNFGNVSAKVSVDASPTEIDLFLWINGDGNCFDDNSSAVVMYAGEKSRYTFKNGGSMNCEGAFHIKFKNLANTPYQLQKLATKKLETIKITGNNKTELTLTVSPEIQDQLMQLINCTVTQGKELIKK